MFGDSVRTIIEGLEKSFDREYAKFDEYSDIEGLSEYKELVLSLRESNILIEFDEVAHYIIDDSNFKTDTYKPSRISNDFFKMANKILSSRFIPSFFPPIHGLVNNKDVVALLMLIEINYFYYSHKKCSRIKTVERVFGGDIIQYLSFFTNEFKSMDELPEYDESFFKKIKKIDFEDNRSRRFEDFLRCGYFSLIILEQDISLAFFNNIKFSSMYLMICNALKRGSLKINCEDVVIGYTLALKLITEDIRPYVRKAFYNKYNEI